MSSGNRFCGNCGSVVSRGQRFCSNCGALQKHAGLKNQKILAGIAAVMLVLGLMGAAVAITWPGKDRVIMIYMMGSNLESKMAAASVDIMEMLDASFDPDHTKLLIYTGGTKKWALDEISADENAIFEVQNGELNKLQVLEKTAMTKSETLTEFVDYAYENYPTDLYDLVLWDHGGGPVFGYGMDENTLFQEPMSMKTLAEGLENTKLIKSGRKFDLVGFDACLMGSIEVANMLKNYSRFMIASEEAEPGQGWNYGFLNSLNEGTVETVELGKNIIDDFVKYYDEKEYETNLSLSMIDLTAVDYLTNVMGDLFAELKDEISQETFSDFSRTMTRDEVYGYTGKDEDSYDLVDLMDLVGSLEKYHPGEVQQVRNRLNRVVIYSISNMENANGMSMYFLNNNKTEIEEKLEDYRKVAFSEEYYEFLEKYGGFIAGELLVPKAVYDDLVGKVEGGMISVELPDELVKNYQFGEIVVWRKLGENKYMPVYRGSDVALDGNTLKRGMENLQFVIERSRNNGKVEYGSISMLEKERTEDYVDYVTYGTLGYGAGAALENNYEMHLRFLKGEKEAKVRDIKATAEMGLASRISFEQDKIKWIDFAVGTYKLFAEDGDLDYNFSSNDETYIMEVKLENEDSYKIKLENLDFDFGSADGKSIPYGTSRDYYAEFIVHDTQGGSHRLNLVHIK